MNPSRCIRTALFPVASLGTRFLPATKALPQEMLPIVDKPLIQYAVEEAVAAGIENIVLVTHRAKRAIEDHFDASLELDRLLALQGKHALPCELRTSFPPRCQELQLSDGLLRLLSHEPVFAYRFEGRRFDCASKLGFLEATVSFGLKHPEVGEAFAKLLGRRVRAAGTQGSRVPARAPAPATPAAPS